MKTLTRLTLVLATLAILPACTARDILLEGSDQGLTKWHGDSPLADRRGRK